MDIPETGAMRALYNQHGAALWRYACRLTSNATRAQDVVQETLLRAYQHQEVVDGNERSTRAWLFTLARDISSNGSGAPEAGGSDELNSALNRTLVADAFARLPAEHRAVVRRAHYYGWTTAQIGADLGIAEGTVKSRLHHALRTLQRTLQEMGVAQ
ncbi:MAG TPA: sigma factor [Mycobacterium sp.]|uniref:sigma factor-like helix-turn-helix DNA-binding protein n=1 Tax=Mycobacterium sp. TaxID=1785 RepID=UPI002D55D5AA|nr:sigma factor [Mycobacterium sp.]HXY66042.1 sigma factor [Mycobacterium sp.]